MRKKREDWNTLEGVLDGSWAMLTRGATRFTDPFHWPVLGTTGADGPRVRTMILRQVRAPERMLICHTDRRAAKVQEILHSRTVSWLFYHPKKRVQLRISGPATLHSEDRFAQEQ
jgi:pyridoxamine 5'-phosphate oxidase